MKTGNGKNYSAGLRYKRGLKVRNIKTRRTVIWMAALCLSLFVGIFAVNTIHSKAGNRRGASYKYFTSVQIQHGDTMESVAEKYFAADEYRDMTEYIAEICMINHISSPDHIKGGSYLIVPYFSGACY